MKTRPRPKTKLPKLVEFFSVMYPYLLENLKKSANRGFTGLLFPSNHYTQVEGGRGWQRVT